MKSKAGLKDSTTHGVIWLSLQSTCAKFLGALTQALLAWFLLDEDFGLYGLAITVGIIGTIFGTGPIGQILIQRQKAFRIWSGIGGRVGLYLGILSAAIVTSAAPWIADFYDVGNNKSMLQWMIVVISLNYPVNGLVVASVAKLKIDMRFPEIARLMIKRNFLEAGLKVSLAYLGFGGLSFCLAALAGNIFYSSACYLLAPIKPTNRHLRVTNWRFNFGSHMFLMLSGLAFAIVNFGDYIVLGWLMSTPIVGLYFFAFQLSLQSINLVGTNFTSVFFSTLSRLNKERRRQVAVFARLCRMVAAVGIPLCFMQAAVASPLMRLVFAPRWYDTILLVEILSVGMAFRVVSWGAASLMEAQGRFRARMVLAWASCVGLFVFASLGAILGGLVGLTVAVAFFYATFATLGVFVAVHQQHSNWEFVQQVYAFPVLAGGISMLLARQLGSLVISTSGDSPTLLIVSIITTLCMGIGCYGFLMWCLNRSLFNDIFEIVRTTFSKFSQRKNLLQS